MYRALAGLAQCLRTLQPADEPTRAAVAEIFGLRLRDTASAAPAGPAPQRSHRSPLPSSEKRRLLMPGAVDGSTGQNPEESGLPELELPASDVPEPEALATDVVPSRLVVDTRPSGAPALEGRLTEAIAPPVNRQVVPPVHLPLFRPEWERRICVELLTVTRRGPGLDPQLALARSSRGLAARPTDQRRRRRMAASAHLLVDVGGAMAPFVADQAHLADLLTRTKGAPTLPVLRFVGTPARGAGAEGPASWERYVPPHDSLVLVLSDLGCSGLGGADSVAPAEWDRFAADVRGYRSRLVAVTPYRVDDVPPAMRARIPVIAWDRSTAPARVQLRLGSTRGTEDA